MRKHLIVIAVIAAAAAAVVAGSVSYREAFGSNPAPTISIQEMHQQVDAASLPSTRVDEPF